MIDNEKAITLSQWLEYWLDTYVLPTHKPAGYEHYADNCRKHIIPAIGHLPLSEITPAVLQLFFNDRAERGNLRTGGHLSPKSIKNMRVILDVAMKQAMAEGRIPANPVPLTFIRRVKSPRVEALSDDELRALEKFLISSKSQYSRAEILAMYTGARRGEICALRWRDYDPESGTISITETVKRLKKLDASDDGNKTQLEFCDVKTDASERVLALPQFLQDLLEEQRIRFGLQVCRAPNRNDFIFFGKKGTILDPDDLTHYHNKVLGELGLKHKKLHALRHSFATRGIENGIDVSTMSGLLGHADSTTTTRFYVRPREAAMQKAMLGIRPVSIENVKTNT